VPLSDSDSTPPLSLIHASDEDGMISRIKDLAAAQHRVLLGITGLPGAGKSTLAAGLADALRRRDVPVAWVPMDGFHLADVELDRLGRRARKGPSTPLTRTAT
jgi:pantothenate kinase